MVPTRAFVEYIAWKIPITLLIVDTIQTARGGDSVAMLLRNKTKLRHERMAKELNWNCF